MQFPVKEIHKEKVFENWFSSAVVFEQKVLQNDILTKILKIKPCLSNHAIDDYAYSKLSKDLKYLRLVHSGYKYPFFYLHGS